MAYTAFIYHPRWQGHHTEATLSWDVSGYYMYLPAIFIYQDIKECKFKDSILEEYKPTPELQQAFLHKQSGNYIMKYAAGQAIIMSPFFAIAHNWASNSSVYKADGFSWPYQVSIGVGMFLIGLIGLFFLRKILLVYFKDITVAAVLLFYVIGSNYLNYSSVDQAMTHNSLFTIYALLVWTTIRFYDKPSRIKSLQIGLLCGLAALIRPPEILSILIPVLWGVGDVVAAKKRLQFFLKNYTYLLTAAISCTIVVSTQLFYWKYASGEWLVYSYEDQGFSWLKPHIWDYSMSYRCGWLRYTPLMVLPLVGLFFYIKKKENRWTIVSYSILAFYITTAWDVWDYGGTSGRAMVQHYVILAFPFATLIEWVLTQKVLKYIFFTLVALFSYLNIWAFRSAHYGDIRVSGATRQYYWAVVGRWSTDDETKKLLDNRYLYRGTPKEPVELYYNAITKDSILYDYVNEERQYSETYIINKPTTDYKWLRVSANFECVLKEWDQWKQALFGISFFNGTEKVQTNHIRVHRLINNGQNIVITLDTKPPKEWQKAKILLWNCGSTQEVRFKEIRVIGFDE